MRNVCIPLFAALLVSGCDEKEICFPQKPIESESSTPAPRPQRVSSPPRSVALILDRSWGMAGFVRKRQDGPMNPPVGEFKQILLSLSSRFSKLGFFQLPDDTANGAELHRIGLEEVTNEAVFDCDNEKKCGKFSTNAYLYKFLQRVQRAGVGSAETLQLTPETDDIILLVTDLQPDVERGNKEGGGRMGYIQKEFQSIVAKPSLAIGMLPVPARFYGTLWDTEAKKGNRPIDPLLSTGDQKQPLFFVPIGRQEHVRWVLDQLKQLVKDVTKQAQPEHMFRQAPQQPDAVTFELVIPDLKPSEAEAPVIRRIPPPPSKDGFSKALDGAYFAVKRSRAKGSPATVEWRPKVSAQADYQVVVKDDDAVSEVWEYIGGAYTAEACTGRWRRAAKPASLVASSPDGKVFTLSLGPDTLGSRYVGATYYAEVPVSYWIVPKRSLAPPWVSAWSVPPGSPWDERQIPPKLGGVTFGVNSLQRLFEDTQQAEVPPQPRKTVLHYAITVED